MFEFPGKDRREKASEAGLDANLFLESHMRKYQFARNLAG